jgi:FkbM family methyltransferase
MTMLVDRFRHKPGDPVYARAARSTLGDLFHGGGSKLGVLRELFDLRREIALGHRAFEDAPSRALFRDIFVYRYLTPHLSRLANNRELLRGLEDFMAQEIASEEVEAGAELLGDPLAIWSVRYNDAPVRILTSRYGLYWTVASEQYFFHRGGATVAPREGDVVLDCGSLVGDTAIKFGMFVGERGKVYGFDPSQFHVRVARENVARNRLGDRIEIFACGVSSVSRPTAADALAQPVVEAEGRLEPGRAIPPTEPAITIDDFCRLRGLDAVDYVKMDIEGSEMDALHGAEATIDRFRPRLAICLYHHPSDLWKIPAYVRRRHPWYRLYLAHHTLHVGETLLYATAEQA